MLHIPPVVFLEIFEGFSGVEFNYSFGAGLVLICFNHLYFFDSEIFKNNLYVFFGNFRGQILDQTPRNLIAINNFQNLAAIADDHADDPHIMQFFSIVFAGLVEFLQDDGQILIDVIFVLDLVFEASN